MLLSKSFGIQKVKKHSKFQKFDKLFYYWMARLRSVKLGVLGKIKTQKLFSKKYIGQSRFKLSKFKLF